MRTLEGSAYPDAHHCKTDRQHRTTDNRMVVCVELLWLSVLMLVPPAFPTQAGSRMNSIQTIVHTSRTTLVRIRTLLRPNTHIIQCPTITVDPPSIRGINSIRQDLSRLEAQLKELAYGPLAQIQTDISSLHGFVGNLAEPLNCVLDHPARAGEGRASGRFCERCVCESLKKVQVYLDELVLHVDQLGAC